MREGFQPTLGAVPKAKDGDAHFRVWAPKCRSVDLILETPDVRTHPLARVAGGYFVGTYPAPPGARYRYQLDNGDTFPDPCSRFQPQGPHGPSQVVDAHAFRWTDEAWPGPPEHGNVLYEIHVGAYTPEGTFAALTKQLPALKDLGVTLLELMPVNGFPGAFNWGYEGVNLFAPAAPYGTPDALRFFVDSAHRHGLGVILDVVYNHLGPDGNYLGAYSDDYFTHRYPGEWGLCPNFDGPHCEAVREFVIENACMWVSEFHLDGLRIDATQNLYDASPVHIVTELTERARAIAGERRLYFVGESERQDAQLVRPPEHNGYGLDAMWVDDFHHAARVLTSGCAEGYLTDYCGAARELVACALRNSLYQNQYFSWQQKSRGTSLRQVPFEKAVFFLQDHDQIANTLDGARLHHLAGEAMARALTVLWLLLPQTPMLFMGQEFFASAHFLFFVDHHPPLENAIVQGRKRFLSQFASMKRALEEERRPLNVGKEAFQRSKLNLSEREQHAGVLALHRELIALRKSSALFHRPGRHQFEAAALDTQALVLRWHGEGEPDRLLIFNVGHDRSFFPCSEPLLAPQPGSRWSLVLSSQESRFGGRGATFSDGTGPWQLQGQAAALLFEKEVS